MQSIYALHNNHWVEKISLIHPSILFLTSSTTTLLDHLLKISLELFSSPAGMSGGYLLIDTQVMS